MASRTISVSEVFESSRFTPYQVMVCLLCFLVTFIDGFDLTIIGVALPKVADFLHSKPSALGLALSAGQFGPLVGAIVLGSLADRWGRKWMCSGLRSFSVSSRFSLHILQASRNLPFIDSLPE